MKNFRIISAFPALMVAVLLAVLMAGFAAPLGAQSVGTSISIGPGPRNPNKPVWLKAEIVRADARSMVVRERGNELSIHTFTYAERIQGPMQQIADAGGYQYGDHVKILYQPGQLVALKVRGKPSKPL